MNRWMTGGVALVAFGCGKDGRGELVRPFTTDLQIDGASDQNDPDSFGTELCVAGTGAGAVVYAVWLDDRDHADGTVDLWMNRSLDLGSEGSWLPVPVRVDAGRSGVESNVFEPDLFCDEVGAFVVWEDDRDGELQYHQIYFNRTVDQGLTFLPEDQRLDDDPDGLSMSLEPRISGSGDDLFVTWYDGLNGAFDILVASSFDGGAGWDRPARVDLDDQAGAHYSARPEVAVSAGAEDVWVVWVDSRDGASDIYAARSDDGGGTYRDQQRLDEGVDAGSSGSYEPSLCADGDEVYVVWHDARNGAGDDIYFNYSPDRGATWLPTAQRLDSDAPGFGDSLFPVCEVGGGVAHVAWYDRRLESGGFDIWYTRIEGGIPSGEPQRIDRGWPDPGEPEGWANSVDPRIALEGDVVAVAWSDFRGEAGSAEPSGYNDLYYNYSTDGGVTFQEVDLRIDSMFTGTSFKKDLSFEVIGGTWLAAWTDGRSGTTDIYFESMAIGEGADPPDIEDLEQHQ